MGDNLLIEPENLDNSVTSEDQNLDAYDDLIISIQSAENILNILICVCDQDSLREKIIRQYEEELGDNFLKYQIKLSEEKLSLTAELEQLVQQHSELKTAKQAVITVTGISSLLGLSFNEEKSPLDTFFGYLQWTREALRQFPYSIVLWINKSMETKLPKNAPDFWSWRKGVFRFVSPIKSYVAWDKFKDSLTIFNQPQLLNFDNQESSLIPLHDLQALIKHLESNPQPQDELKLATLYSSLGKVYLNRIETEGCANYAQELNLAIEYYQKAKDLQQKLNLELDLAESLNNLADLYYYQRKYAEAEPLFLQALTMRRKLLRDEHPHVATSLHNLANLYNSQGKYEEAEPLYLQALTMRRKLLGDEHPDVAISLHNLAELYRNQGKYKSAESLYLQALTIMRKLLGDEDLSVATSLHNLAFLYQSQGKYLEAEPLYLQALTMYRKLLGDEHPYVAISLHNLTLLYESQGKYKSAEPLYLEALSIFVRSLGENHPSTINGYNNFVDFLQEVIKANRVEELSNDELTQKLLKEIKIAYDK